MTQDQTYTRRRPIQLRFVKALLGALALVPGLCVHLAHSAQDKQLDETAAAFKFVRGKGTAVCDAYKKFLDAVPDRVGRAGPRDEDRLMCMRRIPTDFAAFSQPGWTEVNPLEHMELATQVGMGTNFIWEEAVRSGMLASETELRPTKDEIRANYEAGRDRWYVARADIDNDGRQELLVKYRHGPCNPDWPDVDRYAIPIIVFDGTSQTLDASRTRRVLNQKETQSFALLAESYDVFTFQEKLYVDRWENEGEYKGRRTKEKTLSVYLHDNERSQLVCRYQLRMH